MQGTLFSECVVASVVGVVTLETIWLCYRREQMSKCIAIVCEQGSHYGKRKVKYGIGKEEE